MILFGRFVAHRTILGGSLAALVLAPQVVAAHAGHGAGNAPHSPAHYATEPVHSIQIAAVVLLVTLVGLLVAKRRSTATRPTAD
jgi:hypothetical protein